MTGTGRIVVGLDGSAGSLEALRYAVEEARRRQVELVAVTAWLPPSANLPVRHSPSIHTDTDEWVRDSAWQRLWQAFDEGLGGVPVDLVVRPLVVRGQPDRVLVDIADEAGDLLIVGAGRRGRIRRLFASPVSRRCVANATCPVVAVPRPALNRELDRELRRRPFGRTTYLTGG